MKKFFWIFTMALLSVGCSDKLDTSSDSLVFSMADLEAGNVDFSVSNYWVITDTDIDSLGYVLLSQTLGSITEEGSI